MRAARSDARAGRIEAYLDLGLHRLTNREAGWRLGVDMRTIQRYRAELRRRYGGTAG